MHRQVVCLIALDQVLRLFLRSVNRVTFEHDLGRMLFLDRPPDTSCFRVPFNLVSDFEKFFASSDFATRAGCKYNSTPAG